MTNCKLCARKRSWSNLKCYHRIHLEELRTMTVSLSKDSQSPGRDIKPGPPEYEAGVLTTRKAVCGHYCVYCCSV
jgi:hypothetical protein